LGAILVGAAAFIGLLLFVAGGGGTSASDDVPADDVEAVTDDQSPGGEPTTTVAPDTTPPAEVEIIAANGAGVSGLASETADILGSGGYTNVKAVDGTSSATTQVYFVPGSDVDAAFVTDLLKLSIDRLAPMPDPVPLTNSELGTAKIIVLLGSDFRPDVVKAANASTTVAPADG
jgi:hypothetical protein